MEDRTVNLEETRRFLDALGGGEFTFQTFGERPGSIGHPGLNRLPHGTLAACSGKLADLNNRGAAVCVMIAEGDGNGRAKKNVRKIRAVFVDLDGAPLAPLWACAAPPHIVVETSPGKYHAYWRVQDCPVERFTPVQRTLAVHFKGDLKVSDRTRVMRLPGFWHQKAAPYQTRIDRIAPDLTPYGLADLIQKLGLKLEPSGRPKRYGGSSTIAEGERNNTLFEMAWGFRRKGMPLAAARQRLAKANAARCVPPLDAGEVERICESAYSIERETFIRVPHAFVDSGVLYGLSKAEKDALFFLWNQYNGRNNGSLSAIEADMAAAGIPRASGWRGLDGLRTKGLITVTRQGGFARKGGTRTCSLYALSDALLNQRQIEAGSAFNQSQDDGLRIDIQGRESPKPSEVPESDSRRAGIGDARCVAAVPIDCDGLLSSLEFPDKLAFCLHLSGSGRAGAFESRG
jgi:hypothetical protein